MTAGPRWRFAGILAALSALLGVWTSADAAPRGSVTYRQLDGDVFRLAAHAGARPLDVSSALDRLSPRRTDEWLNTSPNGRWLLTSTERFGCGGFACLVRVSASLSRAEPLRALHSDGFGAISSDGALVVYPAGDGPHTRDLWAVRRRRGRWTRPFVLTRASGWRFHGQPATSSDGRRVVMDCGNRPVGEPGTALCIVSSAGGPVRTVVTPTQGPGGTGDNEVHHADFGPGGELVFEADWGGERIWRLPAGRRRPVRLSRVGNDNSPCVLPDGRVVSLWLGRRGNPSGNHEIRVADGSGSHAAMLLTGINVLDAGIGCGG